MTTERIIHCEVCKTYVGTIRDAKLMKGLVFICRTCNETPKSKSPFESPFSSDLFNDTFGDSIFGDVFKGNKR